MPRTAGNQKLGELPFQHVCGVSAPQPMPCVSCTRPALAPRGSWALETSCLNIWVPLTTMPVILLLFYSDAHTPSGAELESFWDQKRCVPTSSFVFARHSARYSQLPSRQRLCHTGRTPYSLHSPHAQRSNQDSSYRDWGPPRFQALFYISSLYSLS